MRVLRVIVLLLLLSMGMVAQAQTEEAFFCADLSVEDCNVLQTASDNMEALNSGSFTANFNFSSPEETDGDLFSIDLEGTWSGTGVGIGTGTDFSATTDDPTGSLSTALQGLSDFNGSLLITISPPQSDTMFSQPIELELRLVESIGYINFDRLGQSLGEMGTQLNLPEGWGGTNLEMLLQELAPLFSPATGDISGSDMGSLTSTPSGSDTSGSTGSAGDASSTPSDTSGSAGGAGDATSTPSDAAGSTVGSGSDLAGDDETARILGQYMTIERSGSSFNVEIDLAGLFNDPEFRALSQESGMEALTQQQIEAAEGSTLSAQLTLSADEQYIETIDFQLEMASEEEPITVEGNITFSDFNEADTVTTPDNVTIATTEELLQGLGGLMGGMGNMSN